MTATSIAPDITVTSIDSPSAAPTADFTEVRDTLLTGIARATADAVARDSAAAVVRFSATGRAAGTVATDVRARRHAFAVDEPASLGGDDTATNPVEYALGAVIGCQVVTYRFWAARLGIAVDDIAIEADGDLDVRGFFGLDDAPRAGFTEVRVRVRLTGPESTERYTELQQVVDAHCPVLDLFARATPIHTTLQVTPI